MGYDLHLDDLFHEKISYVGNAFNIYRNIYDLPIIEYFGEVSPEFFNYVKKRKYFLLLSVYDDEGRIFLERNTQEQIHWSLPGGSLKNNEDFHLAIKRLTKRICEPNSAPISLGEIEPIAFVHNRFRHNKKEFEHLGIAFAARIRNKSEIDTKNLLGKFVHINETELKNINRYANQEVVKLCHKRIDAFDTDFPETEILTNEKFKLRYIIHNKIIKKLILTSRVRKKQAFDNLVSKKIGNAKSFIDVSCGDSDLMFKINDSHNFDFLVGNDISWGQINTRRETGTKIFFTNHNASYLPFRENAFDVLYCGNTLHHMTSRRDLELLFSSCFRVAKKIIFVEIERPSDTGWFPNFLNKIWYRWFLGDAGRAYLDKKTFRSIIETNFGHIASLSFDEFKNVQGRYMIAEIEKGNASIQKQKFIEVEEKFFLDAPTASTIEKRMGNGGFVLTGDTSETDDYFTDPDGRFITDRTCLRLRTDGRHSELTFKGKSTMPSSRFAKVENNIPIESIRVRNHKDILESLGYHKYVSVIKHRRSYGKTIDGLRHNITIDDVENVGSFAEFEILAPADKWQGDEDALKDRLDGWLKDFDAEGWTKADLPYRDFVAKRIKSELFRSERLSVLLLDFDGTIVPSEMAFYRAYRDVIRSHCGKTISIDEYRKHEMSRSDGLFEHLQQTAGLDPKKRKDIMQEIYGVYEKHFEALLSDSRTVSNLHSLEGLKKIGLKLALVTTSKRRFVDSLLAGLGYSDLFETIVAREDVAELKPDPAAFTKAIEELGAKKDDCLAVEDSPRGVAAAKAAGIRCIGVHGLSLTPKEELHSLKIPVFETLTEIVDVLKFA
ncbi:HAD-IA family hydrolase [Candidatus Uhrbacteria bacterium]|nr:HAD-IA family hydrolase [Candidatus Uhrbacteria bacterium]